MSASGDCLWWPRGTPRRNSHAPSCTLCAGRQLRAWHIHVGDPKTEFDKIDLAGTSRRTGGISFSQFRSWALEQKLHKEKLHTDAEWTEEERIETKNRKM